MTGGVVLAGTSPHFLSDDSNGSAGLPPDVRINLPYPKKLTDNCDEWILWIADQL